MKDVETSRAAVAALRDVIAAAVRDYRALGGREEDLAILVDGDAGGGEPRVTAMTRSQLELTVPLFDPTVAIELAKQVPGQVPAVVDLRSHARHIVWLALGSWTVS
ncbi:MAG TPA: hypothetical protein VIF15_20375 [Polyangiaceae bacterium]|jgi:hypothetical protein